jgi:sugar/nucleoside kinase (ribokinase family)
VLYGIGNPLVDMIVRTSAEMIEKLCAAPGSMNLVDYERQQQALVAGSIVRKLPGGSCANTIRGVRWLLNATGSSAPVSYTGAVGDDAEGRAFEQLLDTEGVIPRLARKTTPTGSSAVLVTPDSQRTMFTYLGACRELSPEDVDLETVHSSRVFHLTGYMWDSPCQEEAAKTAVSEGRTAGTTVSFDVADSFVVERYHDSLLDWIPGNVDILFANEVELQSLTGVQRNERMILESASTLAPIIVMKVGPRGCYVLSDGRVSHCDPSPADRIDTTGAGDAFAAGFLFGILHREDLVRCACIANLLAGGIVSVDGCNYGELDSAAIVSALNASGSDPAVRDSAGGL